MLSLLLISSLFASTIVDIVNSDPTATWTAVDYPQENLKPSELAKRLMSARPSIPLEAFQARDLNKERARATLPQDFDGRQNWPGKLFQVRDQGGCGSCWAFALTTAMGDRMNLNYCGVGDLSPQDLVSCDTTNYGCSGGYPWGSCEWVQRNGVTTERCISYKSGNGRNVACPRTCDDGSAIKRYYAQSFKLLSYSQMAQDLYDNGPFQVMFAVYNDFFNYRSGVYQHVSGGLAGYHEVAIIGWGLENNTPYWLVQNSWGADWGLNGYFKIRRGYNECGIEDQPIAITPNCRY